MCTWLVTQMKIFKMNGINNFKIAASLLQTINVHNTAITLQVYSHLHLTVVYVTILSVTQTVQQNTE
jgi:hypothetical protein